MAEVKVPKVVKKSAAPASHPTSAVMIVEAVTKLAGKGGSSFLAIKKYIADVHKVDVDKQNAIMKKALKKLVENGQLTQLKGTGASGSFKLGPKAAEKKKAAVKLPSKKKVVQKADGAKLAKKKPVSTTASKKVTAVVKSASKKAQPTVQRKQAEKGTAVEKKAVKKPALSKTKPPKTLKKATAPAPKGEKKAAPKKK